MPPGSQGGGRGRARGARFFSLPRSDCPQSALYGGGLGWGPLVRTKRPLTPSEWRSPLVNCMGGRKKRGPSLYLALLASYGII